MVHCSFNKRHLTLIWAMMECLFFTGIVFGWPWLSVTLRRDRYFLDLCNITLEDENPEILPNSVLNTDMLTELETPIIRTNINKNKARRKCRPRKKWRTTTPSPSEPMYEMYDSFPLNDSRYFCDEQEERLEIVNAIVMIIRHGLLLPLGIFLDAYGTTRTRLIAVLTFAIGTLVMTFSNASFPWLVIPAFSLISLAGLVILLTNIQVSNLFGSRRNTVMGSLIGAYHSSAIILLAMKETHSSHMETQTSFMFLTIGVVPILVSTIAFLPKSRIPWPLPAGYGKHGEAWKDSSGSRRAANGGQGANKSICGLGTFKAVACSSVYIWSVIWFAIYNLRSFTYDGNIRLMLMKYGVARENVYTYAELYVLLLLIALPFGPCIGAVLDWRRKSTASNDPPIQQMQNILFALVLTFLFALANNILPTIPSLFFQVCGFVLQTIERVAVVTCLCAFLSHVNFPIEHFGKLIGLHFTVASVVSLLRFPFQSFITKSLHGDPFYVNLLLLVLLLVSCGHPINVWYHCRLGLIRDTSDLERERNSANEQLVSEDVVIAAEGTP